MDSERLAEIARMVKTINTEAELQGFCVQLRGQGEYNGTAAHYVETRRREIQKAKGKWK